MNNKSSKVAKNTVLLYIRMAVVMAVNLFTVRLVLRALGQEDYGVYNAVAGVVTMMSFVSTVLANTTQRFYSFSLGEKKDDYLKQIFSVSCNVYVIFSIVVLIIGESIGVWFVNTQLTIPADRLLAANYIFQFALVSFTVTMLQAPYSAAIIAHEDMGVYAIITLGDCFLKFMFALSLKFIFIDRLLYYGAYLMAIPILIYAIYFLWCKKHYPECRYKKVNDKGIYREVLSFSGWSLFSSIASVGMNQVIVILINIFFGPVVNAAMSIALQINAALSSFTASFLTAIRPPIIKSYAQGDYDYLNSLFSVSNKFLYYSLLIICVPLYLNMEYILNLWLGVTDNNTIIFGKSILIYAFILALNNPITYIVHATGKLKQYLIPVETFTLLCAPCVYVLFKIGYPAYMATACMIGSVMLSHITRIFCLKKIYKSFMIRNYCIDFLLPAIIITMIVFYTSAFISSCITQNLTRLLIVFSVDIFTVALFAFLLGINNSEKLLIKSLIAKKSIQSK